MFTFFTVASFIFAFVWLHQQFLSHLIESDLEALKEAQHKLPYQPSEPELR